MPDTTPLTRLLTLFDLERLDRDLFLGSPGPGKGRLFGGLIAAQAVMAAGRTVENGAYLHSLHAYFLRPGNHNAPIRYSVYRIRDGRSFTSRDVVAYQSGEAIFSVSTSFVTLDDGADFQTPPPVSRPPDELRDLEAEWTEKHGDDEDKEWLANYPIEQRHERLGGVGEDGVRRRSLWMRPKGAMPDETLLHTALLAWISDDGLMSTVFSWTEPEARQGMRASLDHAMWFHEPPRWDDWLNYRSESHISRHARALITGAMYAQDGRRVVTVTQEALLRPPKHNSSLALDV
ncbi:MAG: acyl-CoA thioesterase [Dehalococcoidia bacterium]